MPFVSAAQRAWAHATDQPFAAEWDRETPRGKRLPKRVKKRTVKRKASRKSKRGKKRTSRR